MIQENISLKELCSYKTGGSAEFYAEPANVSELQEALKYGHENDLEITVIGSGYNLLIADEGIKGLVINMSELDKFVAFDGELIYAGAGIELDGLVEYCVLNGYAGIEEMSGIPGTVGGAVRMNAGAFGTEIKDVADKVAVCSFHGELSVVSGKDAGFGYRKADGIKGIVTGVWLALGKVEDNSELIEKRVEILERRNEKQPLDYPSCGSVFKRPEGNYAGTLIEKCGLKGFRIGDAMVSEKHANFVLNVGNATSKDIFDVICHVQKTVEEKTGYKLQREVKFFGF
jgi:UDP-N-acetylmuramate dehydrogenase